MISLNIRNAIDNYTETSIFEMLYKNKKLKVSYYDELLNFKDNVITIIKDNNKYVIKGTNLSIESLFKEYLVIKGNIKDIVIEEYHE